MRIFKNKQEDSPLLALIRKTYFADFGMVCSTDWGIVNNKLLNEYEYREVKKLIAHKKLKKVGYANPEDYSKSSWLNYKGDLYKAK